MTEKAVTRVYIDYSNVGVVRPGDHFTTRLLARERRQLREGEAVEIYGDTVEPMRAVVVKIRDPLVEFAIVEHPLPQGVSKTSHERVVAVDPDEFDKALDHRLTELGLTRDEFIRLGLAGALKDDRAVILWDMVGRCSPERHLRI